VSNSSPALRLALATLAGVSVSLVSWAVRADNAIQIENAKPVDAAKDNWQPEYDATYQAKNIGINGIVDGYPSSWSVKNGDSLGLKVSTSAAKFRTRVYRIGWYGGVGSRLVWEQAETAGVKQPFPAENGDTGLVECNWTSSVTVPIGNDWVTGHYVVRLTTDTGMEGFTYFVVRDDAAPSKAPILYVDTLNTAFAYNPWPKIIDGTGKQTQGKSTYSYNSAGIDVQASGAKQAVAVSFDRPHGENWGLGIWRDWTVPTVQFLEMKGYDVAYATSIDLHQGYVLGSRKMWMDSGHDEYWTRAMWDNLADARDKGLNLAWFSGNDLSWQVRYEAGAGGPYSTMVAYKIAAYPDEGRCGTCWDWGGDPEFKKSQEAKAAGDTKAQLDHLRMVSYAWAGLKDWDPNAPSPTFPGSRGAPLAASSPVARVAIGFEGLMNGPKLPACRTGAAKDDPCYGVTWIVDNSSHWVYAGTGLADGDRIPLIVGYEMDNLRSDTTYASRPPTQVMLAHTDTVFTPDKGSATDFTGKFNAQYYQAKSGAHVFTAGTINWFWAVERPEVGQWGGIALDTPVGAQRIDRVITQMTTNVVTKLQEGPGTPPTSYPDGGTPPGGDDGGVPWDDATVPGTDGGTTGDGGVKPGDNGANGGGGGGGCSVSASPSSNDATLTLFAMAAATTLLARRRRV
jgi:MYXO-CTERM domain-containing protein